MSYTVHDWFDDKITCENVDNYFKKNKDTSDPITILFDLLELPQYSFNSSSNFDALLMFFLEDIFKKEELTDIPGQFRYLFKTIAPGKRLTFSSFHELQIKVETTYTSEEHQKSKLWERFNSFRAKEKPKKFSILSLFKLIKEKESSDEKEDYSKEYLSALDTLMAYVRSLDDLEFLREFVSRGIKLKFHEDDLCGLASKLDRLFDMITYDGEFYLIKIVYTEAGQVSLVNYPDLSGD